MIFQCNFYSHGINFIVFYCLSHISLKSPFGTWNKRMYVCITNWINFCFVFWPGPAMASIYDQMSLNATPT